MTLVIRKSLREIRSSISYIRVQLFTSSTLYLINKFITLTSVYLVIEKTCFRMVTTKFGTGGQETLFTNIAFSTGMAPCVVSLPAGKIAASGSRN